MANITIPQLPVAISLTGAEQLEVVQNGVSVRTTVSAIGGGTPPATPTLSVQFNNAGSFGGDANFTYDGTTFFAPSAVLGSATGGYQGAGTINAQGIYLNGVALGPTSPASPTNSLQFNNAGSFGGSSLQFISGDNSWLNTGDHYSSYSNVIDAGSYTSAIAGGDNNHITSYRSFIGGGLGNWINSFGPNPSIYGGSFIGGGSSNQINTGRSFIGTGSTNTIDAPLSAITSGAFNYIGGNNGFIGAGGNNQVNSDYSGIAAGQYNTINSHYSFIGAGSGNIVSAQWSAVVAGVGNSNYGSYASILGGQQNTIYQSHSVAYGQRALAWAQWQMAQGTDNQFSTGYSALNGCSQSSRALISYASAAGVSRTEDWALNGDYTKAYYAEVTFTAISDANGYATFKRAIMVLFGTSRTASQVIGTDIGSNAGSPPAGWSVTLTTDAGFSALRYTLIGAAASKTNWLVRFDLMEAGQSA